MVVVGRRRRRSLAIQRFITRAHSSKSLFGIVNARGDPDEPEKEEEHGTRMYVDRSRRALIIYSTFIWVDPELHAACYNHSKH
jgi:hypothetical protein